MLANITVPLRLIRPALSLLAIPLLQPGHLHSRPTIPEARGPIPLLGSPVPPLPGHPPSHIHSTSTFIQVQQIIMIILGVITPQVSNRFCGAEACVVAF